MKNPKSKRKYDEMTNFFDFAAEAGLTKHIGGIETTQALVELCHLEANKYLLDVGCGVGMTPCYIAKKYGCQVIGVDILPAMIERSIQRAKKEGLTDRVKFKTADAQDLPFGNDLFDAVITESVTVFPEDKQKAVNEYVRVTKPGGYVGLNETTWLKFPPPPDVLAWASQELGTNVKPLTAMEWETVLEKAGLEVVFIETYPIDMQKESRGLFQRYGFKGIMSTFGRAIWLYINSPNYRKFVKRVQKGGITPLNLQDYFGYGLYVGRKNNE